VLPDAGSTPVAWAMLLAGVALNGVASGAYIGAGLGPGPRDGLMTGLVRRTGGSVRLIRTTIEVTVLAVGVVLGGTVGPGTLIYALSIGPLIHVFLPRLTVARPVELAPA
jgi:uncharacterized membrane protein YczE